MDRENEHELQFTNMFFVSAFSNEGMNQLVDQISQYAAEFFAGGEGALITRERHRRALEETLAALDRATKERRAGREDIIAEELRLASRALGRLTGRVNVEDILDVIFHDFCIGK
jgi:tRNA modification GTPase